MSTTGQKASDFFGTLTGFEEIGIEKAFKAPVMSLLQKNRSMWLRSLVFVALKREKDPDPHTHVLQLTFKEITDFFEPESNDDEPDDEADEPDEKAGDGAGEA